jgi:hypothetical protein
MNDEEIADRRRKLAELDRLCNPRIPLTEEITVWVSAEVRARLEEFRDAHDGTGDGGLEDAVRIVLAIGLAEWGGGDGDGPPPPLRLVR